MLIFQRAQGIVKVEVQPENINIISLKRRQVFYFILCTLCAVRKLKNMDTTNRIQFEKPNLTELISKYTVVDLHFHTHYSDGNNSIEEIAKQAGKQIGRAHV